MRATSAEDMDFKMGQDGLTIKEVLADKKNEYI